MYVSGDMWGIRPTFLWWVWQRWGRRGEGRHPSEEGLCDGFRPQTFTETNQTFIKQPQCSCKQISLLISIVMKLVLFIDKAITMYVTICHCIVWNFMAGKRNNLCLVGLKCYPVGTLSFQNNWEGLSGWC